MSNERWFSAKLRFAIMVEPTGGDTLNDRLFLLRAAADFKADCDRALNIGWSSEQEYRNVYGHRVQWRFMEIVSLDLMPSDDLNGCEVYSEPIHLSGENVIPFETQFSPETSKPIQTI